MARVHDNSETIGIAFVREFAFPFSVSALGNVDSVKEITGADIVVGNLGSLMVSQNKHYKLIKLHSTLSLKQFIKEQEKKQRVTWQQPYGRL